MLLHSFEMACRNARRVRTIAAHIGQLILSDADAAHGHARLTVPILARGHALVAVDTFA